MGFPLPLLVQTDARSYHLSLLIDDAKCLELVAGTAAGRCPVSQVRSLEVVRNGRDDTSGTGNATCAMAAASASTI